MIWTVTTEELNMFNDEINQVHPNIKFTIESSEKEINFLDTTVYININKLSTKLYKKPTDRSMYLHSNSYHPNNLKKNIPYGQALQLKKICTEDKNYKQSLKELKDAFTINAAILKTTSLNNSKEPLPKTDPSYSNKKKIMDRSQRYHS